VSRVIAQSSDALFLRAVNATEDRIVLFDTVPDHSALAVWAYRRKGLDRTFKAVECPISAILFDLKRLVVLIAALIAHRHGTLLTAALFG
jgi:hypothetical protein